MGVVFRARDRVSGEIVALKTLLSAERAAADRFAREARLLEELNHPRIVRFIAYGIEPEPFLAMQWLEGEELRERLDREPLGLSASVQLASRVAEGLGAAHARGVYHRDIKPSNLFLEGGDLRRVRLLDFGVAYLSGATKVLTRTGSAIGTPGYMAPEQARGERGVDGRADLFSLGCILYECLTGRGPFLGDHAVAMLVSVLLEQPPPPSALVEGIPPELDALVIALLEKDPEARPSSADEVLRRLRAVPLEDARPAPRPARALSLGGAELRMISLAVLRPAELVDPEAAAAAQTSVDGSLDETALAEPRLDPALRALSADVLRLPDGSMLAIFEESTAADQARRAFTCARLLVERWGGSAVVITARAAVSRGGMLDELIELSAGLLAEARLGEVLMDDLSYGLVSHELQATRRGGGWVLGESLERPARRPVEAPFVGRRRELSSLLGLAEESFEEPRAAVVIVSADGGMGKSRLLEELCEAMTESEFEAPSIWRARCQSTMEQAALSLIRGLLRAAAALHADGSGPAGLGPMRAACERSASAGGGRAPLEASWLFLAHLLGEPPPPDDASTGCGGLGAELAAARRDPSLMAERVQGAWIDLLSATCSAGPLTLVIEDLHFADRASLQLLERTIRRLEDRPLLLIAAARPQLRDRFPQLWGPLQPELLHLKPLSSRAMRQLLEASGGAPLGEALAEPLLARAAGNPYFLEQLLAAHRQGIGGELPASLMLVLERRLMRQPEEARRSLRAASVFGASFWAGAVRGLTGLDEGSSQEWLEHLEQEALVRVESRCRYPGEREYGFRQDALREASYAMLPADERALGHSLALDWLWGVGERDPSLLRHHAEAAGRSAEAARHQVAAARQALDANDRAEAGELASMALEGAEEEAIVGGAHLVLALVAKWRGDRVAQRRHALEAMRALPAGSDGYCDASAEAVIAADRLGDSAALAELCARLLDSLPAGAPSLAQATAAARVAGVAVLADAPAVAGPLLRWLEAKREAIEAAPAGAARLHQTLAVCAQRGGDPARVLGHTRAAIQAFREAGDARNLCVQRVNHASGCLDLGLLEEAEENLLHAIEDAATIGLPGVAAAARQNLAWVVGLRGEFERSERLGEEAIEVLVELGDARMAAYAELYRGRVRFLAGDLEGAEAASLAALGRAAGDRTIAANVAALRSGVELARGELERSLEEARRAARIREEAGGLLEGETFVGLALARAQLAQGEFEAARAYAERGAAELRARAEAIADPAIRAHFLEDAPDHAALLALERTVAAR